MTDTIELRPCPFCGGSVSFHSDDECDGCHYIHCQGCDAMFDFATTADPENVSETMDDLREAIAISWSRRAQPASVPDEVPLDIEAAAQKLAECMDYPWDYMPEECRNGMRRYAKAVVDAAMATQDVK